MSQNPYEAPQTTATPSAVPLTGEVVDVGPEIFTVMQGAKFCYVAILAIASSLVAVFVLGFILPREIAPLVGWALLAVLGGSGLLHVAGLLKMLRIDPASQARGLLLTSLVVCAIVVAAYALVLFLSIRGGVAVTSLAQLGIEVLGMLGALTLMGGLWRIGNYVKQVEISKNAKIALFFYGFLYASSIAVSALLLLPSFQHKVAEWQRMGTFLSSIRPIYFSLVMIATIFYVKALDGIVKLRSKFEPFRAPEIPAAAYQEPGAR